MFRRPPSQNSMYFHRKNMQSLGPACFGKSMNCKKKKGTNRKKVSVDWKLVIGNFLECSAYDGHLPSDGPVTNFRIAVPPNVVNRV